MTDNREIGYYKIQADQSAEPSEGDLPWAAQPSRSEVWETEMDIVDVSVPEIHTQIPWKFVWHANSLGEGTDMSLAELNADSGSEVADIAAGQIQTTSATGLQG
jgi:hypothetical protein